MARLKIVNQFNSSFSLDLEAKTALFELLTRDSFTEQVSRVVKCDRVEFTQLLFQPVPYTETTPKGMPAEYEPYHESSDYIIINVPPNFMFKAKILQPSRLCAIYRKI